MHFLFTYSNYIPEVRIMSIPNLRYMKVSTMYINGERELIGRGGVLSVCGGCAYLTGDSMSKR